MKTHFFEIRGQCLGVNGIAMVLAGNVNTPSGQVQTRNVVGAVAIFELDSSSSCSQSYQLVAQTDAKYWHLRRFRSQYSSSEGGRIARQI